MRAGNGQPEGRRQGVTKLAQPAARNEAAILSVRVCLEGTGGCVERLKGFEPSTFSLGSRRSGAGSGGQEGTTPDNRVQDARRGGT